MRGLLVGWCGEPLALFVLDRLGLLVLLALGGAALVALLKYPGGEPAEEGAEELTHHEGQPGQ